MQAVAACATFKDSMLLIGNLTMKSEFSKTSFDTPLCSFPKTIAILPLRFVSHIFSELCSEALATQYSFFLSCSMQAFILATLTIGKRNTAPADVLYVVAVT